jgi:drug/metabolite transporter (DMT)-like permease
MIWGTTWAAIRVGLGGIPPFTGVALRFGIATVILLAAAWWLGIPLGRRPNEKRLWLVNGVLFFSVSFGVVYWAEQFVPSGLAAVLFALFPLFVALLAHAVLPGERLKPRAGLGIALGFLGIAVIFSEDFRKLGGDHVLFGCCFMLLSPTVSAISSVAVKRWGSGIHPISLAAVPMGVCAAVMAIVALVFESDRKVTWSPAAIGSLLYLAIAGSCVTFTLYYWLLRHMRASGPPLLAYATPVIAVLIGIAFLNEPLTWRLALGAVMVIGGVAIAVSG